MQMKKCISWSVAWARIALVFGAILLGAGNAQAQSLQNVTYVGGTALQGNGLHGKVSVSTGDTLVFEGPSKLTIPYDRVISYESKSHRKVHVGLLAEGLWRLLAPWPEAKQLSLSYRDADDRKQVVVLEMSRGDEALLVEVLKTRVPPLMARPAMPKAHPTVIVQERTVEH